MPTVEGFHVDLTRDGALQALDGAQWKRIINERGSAEIHILYRERWVHLCRTDLKDDVRTWLPQEDRSNLFPVESYRRRVTFGARVNLDCAEPYFAVVDSWSDG